MLHFLLQIIYICFENVVFRSVFAEWSMVGTTKVPIKPLFDDDTSNTDRLLQGMTAEAVYALPRDVCDFWRDGRTSS